MLRPFSSWPIGGKREGGPTFGGTVARRCPPEIGTQGSDLVQGRCHRREVVAKQPKVGLRGSKQDGFGTLRKSHR